MVTDFEVAFGDSIRTAWIGVGEIVIVRVVFEAAYVSFSGTLKLRTHWPGANAVTVEFEKLQTLKVELETTTVPDEAEAVTAELLPAVSVEGAETTMLWLLFETVTSRATKTAG
jgi:hypothetical protein